MRFELEEYILFYVYLCLKVNIFDNISCYFVYVHFLLLEFVNCSFVVFYLLEKKTQITFFFLNFFLYFYLWLGFLLNNAYFTLDVSNCNTLLCELNFFIFITKFVLNTPLLHLLKGINLKILLYNFHLFLIEKLRLLYRIPVWPLENNRTQHLSQKIGLLFGQILKI